MYDTCLQCRDGTHVDMRSAIRASHTIPANLLACLLARPLNLKTPQPSLCPTHIFDCGHKPLEMCVQVFFNAGFPGHRESTMEQHHTRRLPTATTRTNQSRPGGQLPLLLPATQKAFKVALAFAAAARWNAALERWSAHGQHTHFAGMPHVL